MTDGYEDQFGGPKGKKFMSKQLKKILADNSQLSMADQKKNLETSLENWMKFSDGQTDIQGVSKQYSQVDDITVMGVRILR
jgi:serine phosphatase RsbU (regulator of sigma subunit)